MNTITASFALSGALFAYCHVSLERRVVQLNIKEINSLYNQITSSKHPAAVNASSNGELAAWKTNALAEQRAWINKPLYRQLVQSPPHPPTYALILNLGLPIQTYYNPLI